MVKNKAKAKSKRYRIVGVIYRDSHSIQYGFLPPKENDERKEKKCRNHSPKSGNVLAAERAN